MVKHVGSIELWRSDDARYVPADVMLGFAEKHLLDADEWRLQLMAAAQDAKRSATDTAGNLSTPRFSSELATRRVEDAGWRWREIAAQIDGDDRYLPIAIECEDKTQGLMVIEIEDHVTRVAEKGRGLAYVELVTVAPWNRGTLRTPPLFQLVGQSLMATAISASIENGFEGRIGLHSVRGAEVFYAKCGMTNLGSDLMKNGLVYFEMTQEQATAFLKRERGAR